MCVLVCVCVYVCVCTCKSADVPTRSGVSCAAPDTRSTARSIIESDANTNAFNSSQTDPLLLLLATDDWEGDTLTACTQDHTIE